MPAAGIPHRDFARHGRHASKGLAGELVARHGRADGHQKPCNNNLIYLAIWPDRVHYERVVGDLSNNRKISEPACEKRRRRLVFDESGHGLKISPATRHYGESWARLQPSREMLSTGGC